MSRELKSGVRLVLYMGWESDSNLIEGIPHIYGTLPGEGCTSYAIMIMREGDRSSEEILQEFSFRGGGDLKIRDAPRKVIQAFEDTFGRMVGKSHFG